MVGTEADERCLRVCSQAILLKGAWCKSTHFICGRLGPRLTGTNQYSDYLRPTSSITSSTHIQQQTR